MNARILRKWSIHTKNLMSCSVCSLVVVVLLLLLLVTCAPSLVLATMNNSPRSSDASLVVNPMQQHMPKNVVVVADEGATRTTRRTTTSTASATATATSLSSQPISPASAAAAVSATSLQANRRSHRLASPRVEVADNNDDDDTGRESFPGFYTNHRITTTDDIQPTPAPWPLPVRHRLPNQFNSAGGGVVVAPTWLMPANVDNHNKDNILTRRMGWPSRLITSSPPMESYNDDDEEDIDEEEEQDDDNVDDGTQTTDNATVTATIHHDNEQEEEEEVIEYGAHDDDDDDDENDHDDDTNTRMSVRNIDRQVHVDTAATSGSYTQHHFPVQLYNLRRLDDRRHHVAPLQMPSRPHDSQAATSTLSQQQQPQHPTVSELLHIPTQTMKKTMTTTLYAYNNNPERRRRSGSSSIIFSTTDNKSVPGGGGGKDNVFDISNILNVNKIKSSAASSPLRFVIESYEVAAASLPLAKARRTAASSSTVAATATPVHPRSRMLIHNTSSPPPPSPLLRQMRSRQQQQQQAARSRRDSLRGSYSKRYQHEPSVSTSSSSSSPSIHIQSFRKPASIHHHNHNNLRQQRNRKHTRRYCSARDPAQLAFEAPTVFEGKIVSMTPDRRSNFSATVEVREVFKQQIGYRLQKYLRLQFAYRNSSGECDIYREQLRPRGLVKGDTIEPGRMYLLFVQQIDIGNFTILGQPIRKTKRVVEAVRNAVSENYAQLASIRSISASNRTVENGQELRIVCKVTGQPPPKVTWFKDHRSINRNRKLYQFTHYKKRSELIIRSFNTSDAGRYECRAKNKVNRNIERRAIVIKAYPVQRFDPNPRGAGNNCPDDASEFCFNGGTCKFFSEISSYSCICPEGFIGERCDRKEVNNPSTYSNEQECGDKKYFGSYYC